MCQRVVQHEVAVFHQRGDGGDEDAVAGHGDDAVLRAEQRGQLLLELAVQRLLAGGDAARGDTGAVPRDRFLRGPGDVRVARQAQVVVAGPVDHRPAADHRSVVGDALVDVEVRIAQAERSGEAEPLLQLLDLGELLDAIRCLVDRQRLRLRSRGSRLQRRGAADEEARIAVLELPLHAAGNGHHPAVARLQHDGAADLVAAALLERERGAHRALAQRSDLDELLDADGKPRPLQVGPSPVRGELERAVDRERIHGPRRPVRIADPVGRLARPHPTDDALRRHLLDGLDRAHPRTVEGEAAVELVQRHRQLGQSHRCRGGKGGAQGGSDVGGGRDECRVSGGARERPRRSCSSGGQRHGQLVRPTHGDGEPGGVGDADGLTQPEIAEQERRSGGADRFRRRIRGDVEGCRKGKHRLTGELMVFEVRMLGSRHLHSNLVRNPAGGTRVRKQDGPGPAAAQRREERRDPRCVVDERHPLLDERGSHERRNLRHHRRPFPGRILQGRCPDARALAGKRRNGVGQRRIRGGVRSLPGVSEAARPARNRNHGADRILHRGQDRAPETGDLRRKHALDGLVPRIRGRTVLGDSGGMHDGGELSQPRPRVVESGCRRLRHVPLHEYGPWRQRRRGCPACQRHRRSPLRERLRQLEPDATGSTGH